MTVLTAPFAAPEATPRASAASRPPRVLAVASGGGHWVQLMRLRPAFAGAEVHYATVDRSAAAAVAPAPVHVYPDANKDTPVRLMLAALRLALIVLRVRPDVVVSTGAAGGYLAIRFARFSVHGRCSSTPSPTPASCRSRPALRKRPQTSCSASGLPSPAPPAPPTAARSYNLPSESPLP